MRIICLLTCRRVRSRTSAAVAGDIARFVDSSNRRRPEQMRNRSEVQSVWLRARDYHQRQSCAAAAEFVDGSERSWEAGTELLGNELSCANIAAPGGPCCSPSRVPVFCPGATTTLTATILMATTPGLIRIRNPTPGVPLTRREPTRPPRHRTRQLQPRALLNR